MIDDTAHTERVLQCDSCARDCAFRAERRGGGRDIDSFAIYLIALRPAEQVARQNATSRVLGITDREGCSGNR